MSRRVTVRKNSYKDSVRLLEATRAILGSPGVSWGWALMATPANLETLAEQGIDGDVGSVGANDLVLAVQADDDESAAAALESADATLFAANTAADDDAVQNATDLAGALDERPDVNVAIISVPGAYAALETHKALSAGLDVLLFSDNVPLSDEIELKERARELGRLVMGPGAGTAMIAGAGLGFANRVKAARSGSSPPRAPARRR
jgi:FdrA protein